MTTFENVLNTSEWVMPSVYRSQIVNQILCLINIHQQYTKEKYSYMNSKITKHFNILSGSVLQYRLIWYIFFLLHNLMTASQKQTSPYLKCAMVEILITYQSLAFSDSTDFIFNKTLLIWICIIYNIYMICLNIWYG